MAIPGLKDHSIIFSPRVDRVIKKVCAFYNIDPDRVFQKHGKKEVLVCRQTLYYILYFDYNLTGAQMQELFGRYRDSIVKSAIKFKGLLEIGHPPTLRMFQELKSTL